jgi:hypothetical protein
VLKARERIVGVPTKEVILVRFRSLAGRRPSASILISCAALFTSLGGVGYAASDMIGTSQIKNGAVTYEKIAPNAVGKVRLADGGVVNSKIAKNAVSYEDIQLNAVGTKRANINQLQARVKGTCPTGQAFGSVDNTGAVKCNPALPQEYGATGTAGLAAAPATVSSLVLPAGTTYLVFASPEISATSAGTAKRVTASCTLTVGATTVTRSAVIAVTGTAKDVSTATLLLQLAGTSGTSTVVCTATAPAGGKQPAITATSPINALQTAQNN